MSTFSTNGCRRCRCFTCRRKKSRMATPPKSPQLEKDDNQNPKYLNRAQPKTPSFAPTKLRLTTNFDHLHVTNPPYVRH
ncbi:hypothetical protein L484_015957 [Morus notabilis]|uniref:Uncharacterized protein n=1 Tax=Morus notabilis TaxID=981085 RepID=W9QNS2_9ROSA|nr:hypothetical protein L484_015957 [Morus notabilis]